MLDKICSFLLLPFYAIWKMVLEKSWIPSVSKFQIKLVSLKSLTLCSTNLIVYLDTDWIPLKIFVAVTALLCIFCATIVFLLKSSLDFLKKRWAKDKYFEYKISILWSFILFIFLCSIDGPAASNKIITLLMFSEILVIFIFVGFEFPYEPPKKKEAKDKSASWLAKLIPPKPVSSN